MRVRSYARLLPLLAIVAIAACGDEPAATGPRAAGPSSLLDDGSTGGNPGFFFLPPIAPDPSNHPDFSPGQFNASWKPVVRICEITSTAADAPCTGDLTRRRSYEGDAIAVSTASEHYSLGVDTREAWAVGGSTYRARVFLTGGFELGFVDFTLAADKASATSRRTGDVITFNDGRTIPLKFRIENGATVKSDAEVFTEIVVTNAGDTVRAGTGAGSLALGLPAGWLPTGIGEVLLTVERVESGSDDHCTVRIPGVQQTSDCWRIETYPIVPRIEQDLVVAFCPSIPESDPAYEAQVMYKFDAPETLVELENIATDLVNCAAPTQSSRAPGDLLGKLRWGATQVARGLGRVFGPNTAYAIDVGLGGHMIATDSDVSFPDGVFSDFFWGVPKNISAVSGFNPDVALLAPHDVTVRVTGAHLHEGDEAVPLPGVPVTPAFTNAIVFSSADSTDANGDITFTIVPTGASINGTFNIAGRGNVTSIPFAASAVGVAASCGGEGYDVGDQLTRGFYHPSYPAGRLAGVSVRLGTQSGTAGTYTATLVARAGSYNGQVLGTSTVTFTLGQGSGVVTFSFDQVPQTTPGQAVTFTLSQNAGPATLFYSVAQSFDPGDASCPLIETEGTNAPLDSQRRRGVEATLHTFFTPIG